MKKQGIKIIFKAFLLMLKVSKSQKQIIKSWILPKNEGKTIKDIIICFRDLLTFKKEEKRKPTLILPVADFIEFLFK